MRARQRNHYRAIVERLAATARSNAVRQRAIGRSRPSRSFVLWFVRPASLGEHFQPLVSRLQPRVEDLLSDAE
jgi:hypothetical protein